MRIIDEGGAEVASPNFNLGKLVSDRIIVAHHDEVPERPRIEKEGAPIWQDDEDPANALIPIVVTQEYAPAEPAWDEWEDVMRYVPYTEAELAEIAERKAADEAARAEADRKVAEEEKRRVEREAVLDAAPARFDALETSVLDHDEAVTALYEAQAKAQLDTDEALVSMYEMIATGA